MSRTITERIRSEQPFTLGEKIRIPLQMSIPTMMAQGSSTLMMYIDAAMVGQLGAVSSAAIGLVSSTCWLFGGILHSAIYGFSVQISQAVGADDQKHARHTFSLGFLMTLLFSLFLLLIAFAISNWLPVWLGADPEICQLASQYFRTYALFMPVSEMGYYCAAAVQATGNMKVPGILEAMMCLLDMLFNALLIFPSADYTLSGVTVHIYGAGMGVIGAAVGTGLSELVMTICMMLYIVLRIPLFRQKYTEKLSSKPVLKKAAEISFPAMLEYAALNSAMIMSTHIIAPLGAAAIAANSFAVTAESLCYMPGYGLERTASTLVGQSIGAEKPALAKSFGRITTFAGMLIMLIMGIIMWLICPWVFHFMTPDTEVQGLSVKILRIELIAEPFFGASIVAAGALRGAGDTLVPSIMTFVSIWGVRITLSFLLIEQYGLVGTWVAMCIELIFRGIIFLIRLEKSHYLRHQVEPVKAGSEKPDF